MPSTISIRLIEGYSFSSLPVVHENCEGKVHTNALRVGKNTKKSKHKKKIFYLIFWIPHLKIFTLLGKLVK